MSAIQRIANGAKERSSGTPARPGLKLHTFAAEYDAILDRYRELRVPFKRLHEALVHSVPPETLRASARALGLPWRGGSVWSDRSRDREGASLSRGLGATACAGRYCAATLPASEHEQEALFDYAIFQFRDLDGLTIVQRHFRQHPASEQSRDRAGANGPIRGSVSGRRSRRNNATNKGRLSGTSRAARQAGRRDTEDRSPAGGEQAVFSFACGDRAGEPRAVAGSGETVAMFAPLRSRLCSDPILQSRHQSAITSARHEPAITSARHRSAIASALHESALASALLASHYQSLEVTRVEPGVGVQVEDEMTGATFFLADILLSHTAIEGMCFASRILHLDGREALRGERDSFASSRGERVSDSFTFAMRTGPLIPIDLELLEEMQEDLAARMNAGPRPRSRHEGDWHEFGELLLKAAVRSGVLRDGDMGLVDPE